MMVGITIPVLLVASLQVVALRVVAYGKTDESGSRIENPVLVPDLNATIATALGLPVGHTYTRF